MDPSDGLSVDWCGMIEYVISRVEKSKLLRHHDMVMDGLMDCTDLDRAPLHISLSKLVIMIRAT